jgi:LuxR family transcriptional regulator, maltose regulon positive regulatory protein
MTQALTSSIGQDRQAGRLSLSGKVAIATGAGIGMGRAAALAYARKGASVVLAGRREAELRATADKITATGGRFRVHVLGRFRLLAGDAPITYRPRSRKPQELLQALVAFGGIEVGAGVLIDALWPDAEGDAAYHSLESALYRLRQLLGAHDAVRMEGRKVSLNRDQLWVDMWDFEAELQRPHDPKGNCNNRIDRLRHLYQGDFLQHETDKPWVLRARRELRDRFLRAIRDAARECEHARRWEDAANLYRSGIEIDSLNEGLYRGLMHCHLELGDNCEALHAYRRCRDLLTRFFGIPPNAKTQALYHSVRERADCASSRSSPEFVPAADGHAPASGFARTQGAHLTIENL